MLQKSYVIQLVKELKDRSSQSYKDVIAKMDSVPGVVMSHGVFQSKFRRFPERQTNYETKEIVELIQAFSNKGKLVCSPFEAILLCSWTGVSVGALGDIRKFFKADEFDVALRVSMRIAVDQIRWFEPEERGQILALLEKEAQVEEDHFIPFFAKSPPVTDSLITILRNPPEKPSSGAYDEFEHLDHRDIAHLIARAADDIHIGNHQETESFLGKLVSGGQHRYSNFLGDAHHYLGLVSIKKANYFEAREYLEKAFKLRGDSDETARARILGNMGANAFYQGLYSEAEGHYLQSLEIATENKHHNLILFNTNSLATVHHEKGDYNAAAKLYEKALKLAVESNDLDRIAYIYKSIGGLNERFHQIELSKKAYLKSLEYTNRIANTELFIQLNLYLGVLETQYGRSLEGEYLLKQAVILSRDTAHVNLEIGAIVSLGIYYLQEHKWDVAVHSFHETLEMSLSTRNYYWISMSVYGVALSKMLKTYVVGNSDTAQAIRHLSGLLKYPIFSTVPADALTTQFLEGAQKYFQLGLINFPGLNRYRIVEALQSLFHARR